MDQNAPAEPDLYSFNPLKPIADRASACAIFRNALGYQVTLVIVSACVDIWLHAAPGDSPIVALAQIGITALSVIFTCGYANAARLGAEPSCWCSAPSV